MDPETTKKVAVAVAAGVIAQKVSNTLGWWVLVGSFGLFILNSPETQSKIKSTIRRS